MTEDTEHENAEGGLAPEAEPESKPERRPEPEIILIRIAGSRDKETGEEKATHYMIKGDAHLDQMLLADGGFPTPILLVHFASAFDAKRIMGDAFAIHNWWAVHADIVERLRRNKQLVETHA